MSWNQSLHADRSWLAIEHAIDVEFGASPYSTREKQLASEMDRQTTGSDLRARRAHRRESGHRYRQVRIRIDQDDPGW